MGRPNAERTFPSNPDHWFYWEAAWSAYLAFCPAYDDVFLTLLVHGPDWRSTVWAASQNTNRGTTPEANLAAHLMVLYWRGKLTLKDPLLVNFFAKAPVEARAYAIQTLGRWLTYERDEQPSPEILTRLAELWERRLVDAVSSTDKMRYSREIASFAWWFRSGAFDDHWTMRQLEEALPIAAVDGKALERVSYPIIERLAEVLRNSQKKRFDALNCWRRRRRLLGTCS